jgi:hypothetical protein
MSALCLNLECCKTSEPHKQIELMARIARRDELLVCAKVNEIFVSVGWTEDSERAAKDKYDRDYKRLPEHRKRFSIVTHTASAWLLLSIVLMAKGLMA